MSNIVDSAKGLFKIGAGSCPWIRLKDYTSISIIGLDGAGKSTLLKYVASTQPSQPRVLDYIPSLGLNLEILHRGQFVITAQDVGASRPAKWNRDVEVLALNGMAIIFVIDCRARGRLDDALMELERFVPQGRSGSTKSPLAIWCNFCGAEGAMSLEEVETAVRNPSKFHNGLDNDRPFTVKKINARSGDGVMEGLDWIVDTINDQRSE